MATIAPELPGALDVIARAGRAGRRRVGRPHRRRRRRRCWRPSRRAPRASPTWATRWPPMLSRASPARSASRSRVAPTWSPGVIVDGHHLRPALRARPPGARSARRGSFGLRHHRRARPARRALPARRPGGRRLRRHRAARTTAPWPARRRRCSTACACWSRRPGCSVDEARRHGHDDPARPCSACRPARSAIELTDEHGAVLGGADGGRPARHRRRRSVRSPPTRSRRWSAPGRPRCSGWRPARARCRPTRSWSVGTAPAPAPSYDEVRCFTLDEYVGLPVGHPETYRETIFRELTDGLGIARDRVASPDAVGLPARGCALRGGDRSPPAASTCRCSASAPTATWPSTSPGRRWRPPTRMKTLTDQTRRDNARFFGSVDEVPRHVLTQGLGTILRRRHLLLVATGAGKAAAVAPPSRARSPPRARPRCSSCTRTRPCSSTPAAASGAGPARPLPRGVRREAVLAGAVTARSAIW